METIIGMLAVFYGWIFVIGAARKGLTTLAHYAVHRSFSKSQAVNRALGECLTTIFFLANFAQYERDHVQRHHNSNSFTTRQDPDAEFLLELGFTPDKTPDELWENLYRSFYSPTFHGKFLKARFKQNFISAPRYRIAMSLVWWAVLALIAASGYWLEIVIAYLLPLSFPYHISALLQFVSEHEWLGERDETKPASAAHSEFSWGRFISLNLPREDLGVVLKVYAWLAFLLKLLFVLIPTRVTVLQGDMQQHDDHHRRPTKWRDWSNAAYERRDAAIADESDIAYHHFWGLHEAIDHVFNQLGRK